MNGLRKTGLLFKVAVIVFLSLSLSSEPVSSFDHESARKRMIKEQLVNRGIHDTTVLGAMAKVPRHLFVPAEYAHRAYSDSALPIKENQTISQPYIVALMTQSANLNAKDRVLEIGTGSAYQAAILGEIVKEVYTIEIIQPLYKQASRFLKNLGYKNVFTRLGDGYQGWQDKSPFDAILITAAAPKIPKPLVDQLKVGGRMVLPLGEGRFSQDLMVITKQEDGTLTKQYITGVVFVPMTGKVRK
mgnify:CR=1 FL=1